MLIRRIRYWLTASSRRRALRTEMELHLEEKAAHLRASGLSESAARAAARRAFGNLDRKHEQAHEIWIARYWSDLWQDLRHAIRHLQRAPLFAAVAVLSAGLGIGACATIFSLVNFALLRPLPVAQPARLLSITAFQQQDGAAGQTLSFPEIRDLRRDARAWQGVAAFAPLLPAILRPGGGTPRQYSGALVTANYFDVVQPQFTAGGGFLSAEDDQPAAPARIVLTHHVWVNHFHADPSLLGRSIQVNKRPMTVVGITAPGFRGTEPFLAADFFLPLSQIAEMRRLGDNPNRMTSYGAQWLMGLGRLQTTLPDARSLPAHLQAVAREIRARVPSMPPGRGFYAERAGQLLPSLRGQATPALLLLLAVTVLVLLTACANVANLLLARASARTREIATRLAIGAGRGRLVRQLLTESLLLSAGGGILGILLAAWAARHIAAFRLPLPLPLDLAIPIDYRVVFFAVALSLLTGLAFGLVPALRVSRPELMDALRAAGAATAARRRFGLRDALMMGQVAISAALVLCAGLFLRSLDAARHIDTGMNAAQVTVIGFEPALLGYTAPQTRSLLLHLLRETEALPGVHTASVTSQLPLSLGGAYTRVHAAGAASNENGIRSAAMSIGPRYFETLGIPLRAGADFPSEPSREPIAIVNQALAARLIPGQHAVGRFVVTAGESARIVAVAANSKYEALVESKATPILYRPLLDAPAARRSVAGLTLLARAAQPPGPLGQAIRRLVLSRDPDLVVTPPRTLQAHIQESLFAPRLAASLFTLCGAAGLLIAAIGVYGVIAFLVARRTREIGIRIALGARPAQVAALILRQGAGAALAGILLGTAGALALARAAGSLLYGISPLDPIAFAAAPTAVLAVVLLATAVPARRAVRIDPNQTLRAD